MHWCKFLTPSFTFMLMQRDDSTAYGMKMKEFKTDSEPIPNDTTVRKNGFA